jgi:hypothetical protein
MNSNMNTEIFWSGTYRGHAIAVLGREQGWLPYLDHALQPRMRFATADAAIAWLKRAIDRLAHGGERHQAA